jgi:hypothetical protein
MYQLINSNSGAVIEALRHIGVREYLQLRAELETHGAHAPSTSYQARYRKYWRMNAARLSPLFYERYFSLLTECQAGGTMDLERVTRIISDPTGADHGLQFSFATKLLHMIDPRIPVFDSFVAAFYFFRPPASYLPFDQRLSELLEFHHFLRREYARILDRDLLGPALRALRHAQQLNPEVPDERLIDWLLWGWVSLLHKQHAQFHGTALYD